MSKLSVRAGSTGGGTRVRIAGRNFRRVRWVEFGASRAKIVAVPSASAVVVVSPAHAAGVVDVRVRTAAGLTSKVTRDRYRFRRPPLQVSVGTDVGQTFTCARNAAWARCSGESTYGELGNGTTSSTWRQPPVNVKGLSAGVRDISTGLNYACAVTATHAAKCWGSEDFGLLGNRVNDLNGFVAKPVTVHGLGSGVSSITAGPGGANTCAVTTAGAVKCWGQSNAGLLGTNGPTDGLPSLVPVTIAGLPKAKWVVIMSDNAICALTTTGGVYCWGGNFQGQLGAGLGPVITATPVRAQGLSAGVRSLSEAGTGGTACAVTAAGGVKCWGSNASGVLGDGQTQTFSNVPVSVKTLQSGQVSVTVGKEDTACATSTSGGVHCWGYNYDGTLGNGNENDSAVPVQVKGMSRGAQQVSIGTYTVCALTRTGQVKCWGYVPVGDGLSDVPVTLPWYR